MAPDAEYQRIWRQKQKDIAAGKLVVDDKPKLTPAEHMRAYRQRLKERKAGEVPTPAEQRAMSDAALEAIIMKRGRELTAMMRTPPALWPVEWTAEDD